MEQNVSLDRWGIAASGFCLVHCVALPFVAMALPALESHGHEWLHGVLLLLVIPLAIFALGTGLRRHGKRLPTVIGALGCSLLTFVFVADLCGGELHSLETPANVLGSLSLIGAHFYNTRCSCCSSLNS
ncbi:MAG: MerC domain-containing protein [Planctomycetota bacterium]|nr:MerC domain-containing protein [Planctomycetota bacterium]